MVLLHNSSLALYFVLLLLPLLSSISPSLACLSFGNNGLYTLERGLQNTPSIRPGRLCASLTPCTLWHMARVKHSTSAHGLPRPQVLLFHSLQFIPLLIHAASLPGRVFHLFHLNRPSFIPQHRSLMKSDWSLKLLNNFL